MDRKDRHKKTQFVCYFHVSSQGQPMTKYEAFVCILKVQSQPQKTLNDSFRREIVMIFYEIVTCKMREVLGVAFHIC